MLLCIDVGNTNITLGVFEGKKLLGTFRMTTKIDRTSDEYGMTIKKIFDYNGLRHHVGYMTEPNNEDYIETIRGIHPINYRVFTIVWERDELVWFVNNVEVFRTPNKLRKSEKLYMNLCSFIYDKTNTRLASAGEMQVDWVRVYRKK